ncbi:hypothetical protein PU19_25700, partial [Escherichia coli]
CADFSLTMTMLTQFLHPLFLDNRFPASGVFHHFAQYIMKSSTSTMLTASLTCRRPGIISKGKIHKVRDDL